MSDAPPQVRETPRADPSKLGDVPSSHSKFYAVRVAVLLLVLLGSGLWLLRLQRLRSARTDWKRSVQVSVVLLSEKPVSEATAEAWEQGLGELEQWMTGQMRRYRPAETEPVLLRLAGPKQLSSLPSLELPEGGWQRAWAAWKLAKELKTIDESVPNRQRFADVRIFVALEDTGTDLLRVEGLGAEGGNLGVVRASVKDSDLALSLTAVAHELLHCLGASDKYDAEGHAQLPQGLPEPERTPLYPQETAEVMVGEVSLAPGEGELPATLNEVSVGPATAREIRWTE